MFNKPATTENTTNTTAPAATQTPDASENPAPTPQQASSKKLLLIVTVVVLVLAAAFGAFAMIQKPPVDEWPEQQPTATPTATPEPTEEATFCTMDAKICPDGSSVGRVPPSCEFEACPGETPASSNLQNYSNQELGFTLELPTDWPALVMNTASESAEFAMPLQNPRGNQTQHFIFAIIFREKFDIGPGPFYEKLLTETSEGVYVFRGTHEGLSTGPDDTSVDTMNFEKFPPNDELFEKVKENFVLL